LGRQSELGLRRFLINTPLLINAPPGHHRSRKELAAFIAPDMCCVATFERIDRPKSAKRNPKSHVYPNLNGWSRKERRGCTASVAAMFIQLFGCAFVRQLYCPNISAPRIVTVDTMKRPAAR
jgi:hypothetical protein